MAGTATIKKLVKKKFDLSSYLSQSPDKIPDSLFPMLVDKNHPPIIRAVRRGGLNFDTNESPIGDKHSSPIVITP